MISFVFSILILLFGAWSCGHSPKPEQKVKTQKKKASVVQNESIEFQKLRPVFKRQGERKESLLAGKEKGFIGESENGYVLFRTEKGLSSAALQRLKSVVLQENRDRKKMYQYLSRQEKFKKEDYQIMKKNMFESYLDWDPPGVYYFQNQKWLKK